MTATPLPDPALVASVRASLCVQSSMLAGMIVRVRDAAVRLRPQAPDGWVGPAELAHSVLVFEIVTNTLAALEALERAQRHTGSAIWGMPHG